MIFLDKALKILLLNSPRITGIVGTKIYPNRIAEDVEAPCLYFKASKKPIMQTKSGVARATTWTYIFGYKGRTSEEVQRLRAAVCDHLLSKRRQVKVSDTERCLIENVLHSDYMNFDYSEELNSWDEQDVLLVQWQEHIENA